MSVAVNDPQEKANTATHGMGFLLSLLAVGYLLTFMNRLPVPTIIACSVYSATLVLLYAISTLSHAVAEPVWRKRWRMLDQACIFLLIAGSYTPIGVVYLCDGRWWWLLVTMWLLALIGALRVICVGDLPRSDKFAFGLLGLLPVITLEELSQRASSGLAFWLVAGGVFYLTGTIFLRFSQRIRYSHAFWHVFVIAGSACHYVAIVKAVAIRP